MLSTKLSVNNVEMSLDIFLDLNSQTDIVFSDENATEIGKKAIAWVVKVS